MEIPTDNQYLKLIICHQNLMKSLCGSFKEGLGFPCG